NPSHWLAGFGNGGLWESRDAGGSWISLSDSWPTLAVGAVAFAPANPNTIYLGTGESDAGGFEPGGAGIRTSTDAGRTWALVSVPTFARASFKRIRVNPGNSAILCVATSRGGYGRNSTESVPGSPPFGIYRSGDGSTTWVRTLAGQATALETDPTNFNNQYAAIGEQRYPNGLGGDSSGSVVNGLYRCTDGVEARVPSAGPWGVSTPATAAVGRIELSIAPSNPNVLYASFQVPPNGGGNNTGLLGLYRTENAWAANPTWIRIPTGATRETGYCGPDD